MIQDTDLCFYDRHKEFVSWLSEHQGVQWVRSCYKIQSLQPHPYNQCKSRHYSPSMRNSEFCSGVSLPAGWCNTKVTTNFWENQEVQRFQATFKQDLNRPFWAKLIPGATPIRLEEVHLGWFWSHTICQWPISICLGRGFVEKDILFIVLNSDLPNVAANELFQTKYCEDYA